MSSAVRWISWARLARPPPPSRQAAAARPPSFAAAAGLRVWVSKWSVWTHGARAAGWLGGQWPPDLGCCCLLRRVVCCGPIRLGTNLSIDSTTLPAALHSPIPHSPTARAGQQRSGQRGAVEAPIPVSCVKFAGSGRRRALGPPTVIPSNVARRRRFGEEPSRTTAAPGAFAHNSWARSAPSSCQVAATRQRHRLSSGQEGGTNTIVP